MFQKKLKHLLIVLYPITTNIFRVQAYDSIMCGYFCIGFIDFMLAGKKLTEFTDLFCPDDFKKNYNIIWVISKMNENNSIECNSAECNFLKAIDKTNLSEQTKFRLSEIIEIENYFYQEINQRKSSTEKLDKYIAVFDHIDQALIVLNSTSAGVSIILFTSTIGAPVGMASVSFTLIFSLITGIVKKNTEYNKKKKEKAR